MLIFRVKPYLIHYDWLSIYRNYKELASSTDTVLEIGASNIKRTRQLAKHCRKLIGVEIRPNRTPQNNNNIQYITGDWQQLSSFIKPDSIDLAISSHTIEHVLDDLNSLNELYAVLKKGGTALINTPNKNRLTRRVIETFSKHRKFPWKEHIREYSETDLHKLIKDSKFSNYHISPIVLGLHGAAIFLYSKSVPNKLRSIANFWEIRLTK